MYLKSENFGDLLAALRRGIYEPVFLLSLDNREILHRADRIFRTSEEQDSFLGTFGRVHREHRSCIRIPHPGRRTPLFEGARSVSPGYCVGRNATYASV